MSDYKNAGDSDVDELDTRTLNRPERVLSPASLISSRQDGQATSDLMTSNAERNPEMNLTSMNQSASSDELVLEEVTVGHVLGTFNQSNISKNARGNQCTCIVAAAAAYAIINPIMHWTTENIDAILRAGDAYDRKCRTQDSPMYLLPADATGQINICNKLVAIIPREDCALDGLRDESETGSSMGMAVKIDQFFRSNWNYGFLVTGGYTMGLFSDEFRCYYFDSHSRDRTGKTKPEGGTACLLTYNSSAPERISTLVHYNIPVSDRVFKNDRDRMQVHQFTIVPIEVTVLDTTLPIQQGMFGTRTNGVRYSTRKRSHDCNSDIDDTMTSQSPASGTSATMSGRRKSRTLRGNYGPQCYVCGCKEHRLNLMPKLFGPGKDELQSVAKLHRENMKLPAIEVTEEHRLCSNCYQRILKSLNKKDGNELTLTVALQHHGRSCIICGNNHRLVDISLHARIDIYIHIGMFVQKGARSCIEHFSVDRSCIIPPLLAGLTGINQKVKIAGDELSSWFTLLRQGIKERINSQYKDETSFSEEEFKTFCGISKAHFCSLYALCLPIERSRGTVGCKKKDLIMFLVKLRQGLSDEFLKVLFKYSSRRYVSQKIADVREMLMGNFVPNHLGLNAMPREHYVSHHVTDFSNALYNSDEFDVPKTKVAILTIDGTYIYIPKSSNYRVLRQTFSVHKGRHLVKPIMLTAPDGYILDVHGPYFADGKNNDASCLKDQLKFDNEGLRAWLKVGDICTVDRGYRDSISFLQSIGIRTKMPAFLAKGLKQHDVEESNASRLVTKTRWIVEARNGHIKSMFKFFRDIVPAHHVPHIGEFFRIACALINAYSPTITMKGANEQLAKLMLEKAKEVNVMKARVEVDKRFRTKNAWLPMETQHLHGFPKLNEEYLRDLTMGVYQMKLAKSYIQDKMEHDLGYAFQVLLEEPGILRARTFSRFRSATKHELWIGFNEDYNPYDESQFEVPNEPIISWYCKCKAGARTVGCCAHIASVLWFMGFARHQPGIKYPSNRLLSCILDAGEREMPVIFD